MRRRYQKRKETFYVELRVAGRLPLLLRPQVRNKVVSGLKWSCENRGLRIYDYTILPDRVVMLANTAWGVLSEVLESYKGFSSKSVMLLLRNGSRDTETAWTFSVLQQHGPKGKPEGIHIWEDQTVMESVVRQDDIDRLSLDIHNRAVKMGLVNRPEHYLHCSACPQNPLDGWIVEATDPWS